MTRPDEEFDALRSSLVRIEARMKTLKQEKDELLRINEALDEQNTTFLNVAVAFHRLFSSKDYAEIIGIIKETLINLVGVRRFEIYVLDKKSEALTLVTREGEKGPASEEAHRIVRQVVQTGELYVAEREELDIEGHPVSCIPLKVDNEVLGVIVLHELLVQKSGLHRQDRELFKLLGNYASMAIYFSKLNWIFESEIQRRLRDGVVDLTPPTVSSMKSIVSNLVENKR